MEELGVQMLLWVIIGGFVAAFVDAVVGGGGLIAVPVLLLTGMPPTVALGTNKLAASMCSCTSMITFMRSGKVELGVVGYLFPLALLGSVSGTLTLQFIPSSFLRPMVVVMLVAVTIYTLIKKQWGRESTYTELSLRSKTAAAAAAVGLGFYDGFFGPGTGSFLLFVFLMLGFDFVTAAGNSKVLNFASNIASLGTFIYLGLVNYSVGIPMGIAMIGGALLGSKIAIRKGSAYVRPLFITVTALLIGKQLLDLI